MDRLETAYSDATEAEIEALEEKILDFIHESKLDSDMVAQFLDDNDQSCKITSTYKLMTGKNAKFGGWEEAGWSNLNDDMGAYFRRIAEKKL